MYSCTVCSTNFKSALGLRNHMRSNTSCNKYKFITFTCNRCGFITKNMKNIDLHVESCSDEKKNTEVSVEKQNEILKKLLITERSKIKLLVDLLKNNCDINCSKFFTEEEDLFRIYNTNEEPLVINNDKQKTKYSAFDNNLYEDDINTEVEDKIDKKDEEKVINYNILELYTKMDENLEKLKNSRIYTNILEEIKPLRWLIFDILNIQEYIVFLNKHINTLLDVFREKKINEQKMHLVISKNLYPLEKRLIAYKNYVNVNLDNEEIVKLRENVKNNIAFPKAYVTYCPNKVQEHFYNYSIVVLPITELISVCLINKYGFHNLIYVPLKGSSLEDPFSFYILEKIQKDNKKHWKMDCRLEETANLLMHDLLENMINQFRIIYKDVFGDNDYRTNFESKCAITENDLEQLIFNIIKISKPKSFCKTLQNIVMKKAFYKPNEYDKFNLLTDDSLQRKRFSVIKDHNNIDIFRRLFDTISIEDLEKYYTLKNSL